MLTAHRSGGQPADPRQKYRLETYEERRRRRRSTRSCTNTGIPPTDLYERVRNWGYTPGEPDRWDWTGLSSQPICFQLANGLDPLVWVGPSMARGWCRNAAAAAPARGTALRSTSHASWEILERLPHLRPCAVYVFRFSVWIQMFGVGPDDIGTISNPQSLVWRS